MVLKEIIKGKSAWFCDVCGKEVKYTDLFSINVYMAFTWKEDACINLCPKHSKKVKKYLKELKGGSADEKETS